MTLRPFATKVHVEPRTILERAFGKAYEERADLAIRNLLVERDPTSLTPAALSGAARLFGVSGRRLREVFRSIWTAVAVQFTRDGLVSQAEADYLVALAQAFTLSEDEVSSCYSEAIAEQYEGALSDAVRDSRLDDQERLSLSVVADRLRIPERLRAKIQAAKGQELLDQLVREAVADGRLSEDERRAIELLSSSLGLPIDSSVASPQDLARFTLLWQVENGLIPEIPVPINLQRGERAHWTTPVQWLELRTRTQRINYAGPTVSIPIIKGVRFRLGSIAPQRITTDELTVIDSGTLYITSKRLVFDGSKKNTSIRYSALIGIQVYKDAIVLEKATGRSPHLVLKEEVEIPAAIISAVMATSS